MLLRVFNRKSIFIGLLIPIAGSILWMQNLLVPHLCIPPAGESAMPLFATFCEFFKTPSILPMVLSYVLVTFNSFAIVWLNLGFRFLPGRSWLPGLIYFITISSAPSLQTFHPVHFATLFVLLAIYFILGAYHSGNDVSFTFNASFSLAVATLFYFPAFFLLPLIWISIFVLQKNDNWRLMVVPFWGFLAPWLLAASFFFLNDKLGLHWKSIVRDLFSDNNQYLVNLNFLIVTGFVALLTLMGSVSLITTYGLKKVSSRKTFVIFYWMLGLVIASALLLRSTGSGIIALLTIPTTYFISHFFILTKRTFWSELLFLCFIATLVITFYLQTIG